MRLEADGNKLKPILILIIMLALISTWYVCNKVILSNIEARIEFADEILSGQMKAPYQYRVLKPLIAEALQILISPLIRSTRIQHVVSYSVIAFVTFLGIFYLFYLFLRNLFTEKTAIIGVLLLQAVIPLSVTGYFMVGDFIAVFFFLLGFNLMLGRRDIFLPLVIGLATLNREQMIFLVVFYVIYLISQQKIFNKRNILIVTACIAAFLLVFFSVRFYFGFKPTDYIISLHVARNTNLYNLFRSIIPLWLAGVAGFIALCAFAFNKSNTFFKLSFLSLGLYTLLFFLNANLWEIAKFLPAFLIMIPMGLQILTGEFVDQAMGMPEVSANR